jgi:phospholipid/cholesterol/gamma-HCH transport system ATP-binding protein
MTVLENVMLPIAQYTDLSKESIDLIARMKLNLVGLKGSEEKMPSELSGGMIKRAALARAMALDPDILFLDEPSAGLDPITSAELDQLIIQLSKSLGVTFVIVTHELNSIYNIADRVIMLDKDTKGIIATGEPEYLRDNSEIPIVQKFFKRQTDEQLGG